MHCASLASTSWRYAARESARALRAFTRTRACLLQVDVKEVLEFRFKKGYSMQVRAEGSDGTSTAVHLSVPVRMLSALARRCRPPHVVLGVDR